MTFLLGAVTKDNGLLRCYCSYHAQYKEGKRLSFELQRGKHLRYTIANISDELDWCSMVIKILLKRSSSKTDNRHW